MRFSFYILYLFFTVSVTFTSKLSEYSNIQDYYDDAIEVRNSGDPEGCLQMLLQIEDLHIESNYAIAELYLNQIKNPNIALDYYKNVILKVKEDLRLQDTDKSKNLYRKSLFMVSYIYSNYLGMYSDALKNYELFLKEFPNDELIESVKYEMELLKPFEESKKQLIGGNNG